MSRFTLWICFLLGAAFARGADSSLADARRAQAELGPDVWSEIIRVENVAHVSRYPRVLHALVFEMAGILWFYTDTDGTQSLSLHRDRLAEEKADLAPLLHAIEPGFARWAPVDDDGVAPTSGGGRLRNGCFIDSLAMLRARRRHGEPAPQARLLSYYIETERGLIGHTVLTFAAEESVELIDPTWPEQPRRFPAATASDPLELAREFAGGEVARAQVLPIGAATFAGSRDANPAVAEAAPSPQKPRRQV